MTALRASFVRSPEVRIPLRAIASAGAPAIVPRSGWGADESIRRNAPQYASSVRLAIVHHTAGPNDYSPAQAAAIMRGIQLYHVKSNGWNDIGYNFLVDRYGTVYEGRYGGVDRNVVGAHARGFNTGSVGVAVIGTFETANIPAAAEAALSAVLAWRLDLAHVDPLTALTFVSGGSERYPSGIPVFLQAVSGHRDTGLTSCPGDLLYARLGAIAGRTQAIGLPKLYEAKVTGGLGGLVRIQARVSAPLPWRIAFTDSLGTEIAAGEGTGPTVDWTWDTTPLSLAGIKWTITVAGATPIEGTLGQATSTGPLAITGLAADPETISPNDDGEAESATITYTTTAPATVGATLLDAAGQQIAVLQPADDPVGRGAHVRLRRPRAAGRRLHDRCHGRRHGGPHDNPAGQGHGHPHARPGGRRPGRVHAERRRTLGRAAGHVPARSAGHGEGEGPARRRLGCDAFQRRSPGRAAGDRLGREEASRDRAATARTRRSSRRPTQSGRRESRCRS